MLVEGPPPAKPQLAPVAPRKRSPFGDTEGKVNYPGLRTECLIGVGQFNYIPGLRH